MREVGGLGFALAIGASTSKIADPFRSATTSATACCKGRGENLKTCSKDFGSKESGVRGSHPIASNACSARMLRFLNHPSRSSQSSEVPKGNRSSLEPIQSAKLVRPDNNMKSGPVRVCFVGILMGLKTSNKASTRPRRICTQSSLPMARLSPSKSLRVIGEALFP